MLLLGWKCWICESNWVCYLSLGFGAVDLIFKDWKIKCCRGKAYLAQISANINCEQIWYEKCWPSLLSTNKKVHEIAKLRRPDRRKTKLCLLLLRTHWASSWELTRAHRPITIPRSAHRQKQHRHEQLSWAKDPAHVRAGSVHVFRLSGQEWTRVLNTSATAEGGHRRLWIVCYLPYSWRWQSSSH